MTKLEVAKINFKHGQDVKRKGKHYHAGHRADFYLELIDGEAFIYVEESRERADWKDNFDFILVKGSNGKYYHRGFYINAMIMLDLLKDIEYTRLHLMAYSQGAAVAQIVSDFTCVNSLITFGCPNNVWFSRELKERRSNHIHYAQGSDLVFYVAFLLRKYGKIIKLPSIGNPIDNHKYYWLRD